MITIMRRKWLGMSCLRGVKILPLWIRLETWSFTGMT